MVDLVTQGPAKHDKTMMSGVRPSAIYGKIMNKIVCIYKAGLAVAACLLALTAAAFAENAHDVHAHQHGAGASGKSLELGTSAAMDKEGRLWAVTREVIDGGQFVVLQTSTDMGKTWSSPEKVLQAPEPIAANGEVIPKIAFGSKGEIYITYTKPIAPPHIGDVRFVRSLDGGRTFSAPVTVHANRDVITHNFESMIVDRAGRIYIAWIDGRGLKEAKARHQAYSGSAVYYAVSDDGGATFKGDYKVADHSCECCRIGLALNQQGNPVALWRHVFAPNIRDHALAELTPDGKRLSVTRATFDDWRIDACPHHGPSIAYGPDGVRHQVWFNGKDGDGGGVLYAAATATGTIGTPMALGSAQASHADVAVHGKHVALVWKQFDGQTTAILAKLSDDGGASWHDEELARTSADSDQPHLITSSSGNVLVWRTQNEGIRVIPAGKEKP
ncbi:MAG: exo-alpha-sialidase [Herminiimonas sp.]|nr:exo-alpha-sialidase [Herminiimonas sp.]